MAKPTTRKLRSSCNSCGSAKVKCDRQQPECQRCKTNGLQCIYGISRKFGRPPRRRTPVRTTQVRTTPTNINTENTSNLNSSHQTVNTELTLSNPVQPSPSLDLTFLDPQLLQLDLLPSDNIPFLQENTLITYSPNITYEPIHSTHSCALEPYEILANLICPTSDLHPPSSNAEPLKQINFDQVLLCTKKAIDKLIPLLKCACSFSSGHRIMVIGSIVSRILMWYKMALDTSSGTFTGTFGDYSGFIVNNSVKITVGGFRVENEETQRKMRREVMLSEVERMGREGVIEWFEGVGAHITGGWVRKEYEDLVRELKG
ncbi:hypothetical protein QBC38DRAFT_530830 [Podospora fimiseda]|uniref:Zn(2)-C6 fungal-type domain-containing protein n=1 Tax=Podospora fimiseda TaxID=252190 RepID=A0AAN7GRT0_9PEZI|nr:hypothetical protein QBC38DRAFT_530830 [Podospora fimiseda]